MAEGWTRHLWGEDIDVWSAGIEVRELDPKAVKVMAEAGVDISQQRPKHVKEVLNIPFDYVITVCDRARESCPIFPHPVKKIHKSFDDPPFLAKSAKSEEKLCSSGNDCTVNPSGRTNVCLMSSEPGMGGITGADFLALNRACKE